MNKRIKEKLFRFFSSNWLVIVSVLLGLSFLTVPFFFHEFYKPISSDCLALSKGEFSGKNLEIAIRNQKEEKSFFPFNLLGQKGCKVTKKLGFPESFYYDFGNRAYVYVYTFPKKNCCKISFDKEGVNGAILTPGNTVLNFNIGKNIKIFVGWYGQPTAIMYEGSDFPVYYWKLKNFKGKDLYIYFICSYKGKTERCVISW